MDLNIDIKDIKQMIAKKFAGNSAASSDTNPAAKKTSKKNDKPNPLTSLLGSYCYAKESMLGVEITPHYVRVCQMKNSYDQWILNNLASACMETQFRTSDIQMNPDMYVENLRELISKNKITTKNVAFSVPTSSSIVKILSFPDMDDNDFHQAAALGSIWESAVMLEGSIGEYSVYYRILRHTPAQEVVETAPVAETPAPPAAIEPEVIPEMVITQEILPAEATDIEPQTIDITNATDATFSISPTTEDATIDITADAIPSLAPDATITDDMSAFAPDANLGLDVFSGIDQSITETPAAPVGPTMDVLFVASKIADIYLHADIIRRAGLNPVLADVRGLSLKHAFESNPKNLAEVKPPYAFMEFGPDDNYIFIVDGDRSDIHKVFVSDDDISTLIYSAEDNARMEVFVQNYAAQADQILANHVANFGTNNITTVFVSSSAPLHVNDASALPLIKSFSEKMSMLMGGRTISECNFCKHIIVPEKFAKQVNAEGNIGSWAATIGIASRKLDIFSHEHKLPPLSRVNLLPGAEDNKKAKRTSIFSTMGGVALLLLTLSGVGLTFLSANNLGKQLANAISGMNMVESEYNTKVAEAQKLTVILKQASSLDDIKKSLPSNQSSILSAYRHITEVIPEGIWLTQIEYTVPHTITIEGNATDDPNILAFVKKLNQGDDFEKVSLKTMEIDTKTAAGSSASTAPTSNNPIKKFTLEGRIKDTMTMGLKILTNEAKNGN